MAISDKFKSKFGSTLLTPMTGVKSFVKQTNVKVKKVRNKKRVARAIGLAFGSVILVLVTAICISTIHAAILNKNALKTKNPSVNDVIDSGSSYVEYLDGQIQTDKFTDEEKAVMLKSINNLILEDANSHSTGHTFKKIDEIISFSLYPYNLDDHSNLLNKYYLSILFKENNQTYSLNYITGLEFDSTAMAADDFVADFVNYLNFACAIDSCQKMSPEAAELKDLLNEEVTFVGDPYVGQDSSGDKYYYIPVFLSDGTGSVFSAWKSAVDAQFGDPLEILKQELLNGQLNQFMESNFRTNAMLDDIADIYKQLTESQNAAENSSAKSR